jgi:hypothetical protein
MIWKKKHGFLAIACQQSRKLQKVYIPHPRTEGSDRAIVEGQQPISTGKIGAFFQGATAGLSQQRYGNTDAN